jgi:thiamine kinase-like enzyme
MAEILNKLIGQYNLAQDGAFSPLPSLANKVWLYGTTGGGFVVKNYKFLSETQITRLHHNINIFIKNGITTPALVKNKQGMTLTKVNGELFDISEYIDHKDLNYREYNITATELEAAGKLLYKLHQLEPTQFKLKKMNLLLRSRKIVNLIKDYKLKRKELLPHKNLEIVDEYLVRLEPWLAELPSRLTGYGFLQEPYVVTHGDFSLVNLLPAKDGTLFIVDWDNLQLRPAVFELQRTIGVLCGKGKTNGNIDEPDPEKIKSFFKGYFGDQKLSVKIIDELAEVAEYSSHLYWLEFTLGQSLKGDYRILEILSPIHKVNFAWLNPGALDRYKLLLTRI